MQLPTSSNSVSNLNTTDYPFLTQAEGDQFLTSMGISATFRKNNEVNGTYEVTTEQLTYSAVLKGPGLCPTDFLCRRDIHKDTVTEHHVTGELPDWALALKQPQSSSTLRGGMSSMANSPSSLSSLSAVTTPVNTALRSMPASITSPGGGSASDSSSSSIYFTPVEPSLTQANPRTPSPIPATSSFTIKIPARRREVHSSALDSTAKCEKLTAMFLSAKKKATEAKMDRSEGQPNASPTSAVDQSALFSPYTAWLFEYSDKVYAETAALPSLASRITALGNATSACAITASASGSSGVLSQAPSVLPDGVPMPAATTFVGTACSLATSLLHSTALGSRRNPANASTVTNSVADPASRNRNKKRIVHKIFSDDEEVPVTATATSKRAGKGGVSAANGKTVAPSQKKRKSSN